MLRSKVVVVIPAYNEAENLQVLIPEIFDAAGTELVLTAIVVDDGSTDSSCAVLDLLCEKHQNLIAVSLPSRGGKARALSSGLSHALELGPDIICLMDGDCQDNPVYLPLLAQKALSGFDLVTARRANRAEKLPKRLSSKIYNRLVRFLFGTPGRDHNSGMKALSPRLASFLVAFLHGDMHRHISVLAHWHGFSLSELPVINRERREGKSKYGIPRLWIGLEELVMVRFLLWRLDRRLDFIFYLLLGVIASGVAVVAALMVLSAPGATLTVLDYAALAVSAMVVLVTIGQAIGIIRSGRFFRQIQASSNSVPDA
jgi:glycosyltransferase involved in cell wall biosynthesis